MAHPQVDCQSHVMPVLILISTSLLTGQSNLLKPGIYFYSYIFYLLGLTKIRWLYSQILAEDANFKQKARARSNITKDPPLGPGWGTFVENEAYLQHIATAPNKTEVLFTILFLSMFSLHATYPDLSLCWVCSNVECQFKEV